MGIHWFYCKPVRTALLALLLPFTVAAAPFTPASDAEVLERVPARSNDPRVREMEEKRAAWLRNPKDPELAVRLARRWYDEALAQGDPRYVGYAQAALGAWWSDRAPPVSVRIQRAKVLQYGHRFDEALVDLEGAERVEPDDPEAWANSAAIRMVQANYAGARR